MDPLIAVVLLALIFVAALIVILHQTKEFLMKALLVIKSKNAYEAAEVTTDPDDIAVQVVEDPEAEAIKAIRAKQKQKYGSKEA